jgi:hypothetical protein
MKSITTLLAAAAILVAPVAAQNAHGQVELTLGGGMNSPLGEYGDQVNAGYAVTAGIGYRFMPLIVVGAEVSLYGNKGSDELLAPLGPTYEMSSRIQQYAGMAKLLLPVGNHNVFAKGLVGSYRASATVSGPLGEASASNSEVGYGLGGGLLINGSRNSSLYLDVTYHHIAYDGSDIDTNFLTFSAGGVFRFSLFD